MIENIPKSDIRVIPEDKSNIEAPGCPVVAEVSDTQPVIPKFESHVDASDVGVVKALHQGKPKRGTYNDMQRTKHALNEALGKPKRGKDIKTFADLSPSVQQTINTLSDDKAEHKRRTAIAVNYQHQFPGRFHSTGVI